MQTDAAERPRTRSPYPERGDRKFAPLDLALAELFARVSSRTERRAARLASRVPQVEAAGAALAGLSDADLTARAGALRGRLLRLGFRPDLVAESFALVREASARRLGMRHHPVQLQGGWALVEGRFVEMQTGEGKSMTALLAAVTAALAGRPVHVVTVNDYLASRDAAELAGVYGLLGLTVGAVHHGQEAEDRRAAYACDVTYVANKEVAFDYLRDGLTLGRRRSHAGHAAGRIGGEASPSLLLRGLGFAIIDEADSVLVDEARTPLIIAGAGAGDVAAEIYPDALALARRLQAGRDFAISADRRRVDLTSAGSRAIQDATTDRGSVWTARRAREDLLSNALAALHLYRVDQHYVVADGKIQIIDEYTGRIAEGRSWQNGLHQLIEVKEGCEVTPRQETRSSITYQRFFRRYLHLCGMSGTIREVAAELRAVYGVPLARIPTHRPSRRVSEGFRLFVEQDAKWRAVIAEIETHRDSGRAVLVGARSIDTSQALSRMMDDAGIVHVVLNAHNDAGEAAIVAEAGQPGRVTVATNMAGRGTDIKLAAAVRDRGGLHVVLTEFHDTARLDRQFIGRGARQGDPGSYAIMASLDDELVRAFLPRGLAALVRRLAVGAERRLPGILPAAVRRLVQRRAERLEYRIRRQTLRLQEERDVALAFARPD